LISATASRNYDQIITLEKVLVRASGCNVMDKKTCPEYISRQVEDYPLNDLGMIEKFFFP